MLGPLCRSRGSPHLGSNFDLEEAHLLRHNDGNEKKRSFHDILKKASRFWLGLAAVVLIAFFMLSSLLSGRQTVQKEAFFSAGSGSVESAVENTRQSVPNGEGGLHHSGSSLLTRLSGRTKPVEAKSEADKESGSEYVESSTPYVPNGTTHEESAEVSDEEDPSHEEWSGEEGDEWNASVDREESHLKFAEEFHADRLQGSSHDRLSYDSDTGVPHLEHETDGSLDEGLDYINYTDEKQHPDEPHYVDLWDGVSHDDLHLSKGLGGLKTPLYRLPFVEGQHNGTHVVGVHERRVRMPRFLKVDGGKKIPEIAGSYEMLMVPDGRPKPHLFHGRLLWRKTEESGGSSASDVYLFYDHSHHTWIFSQGLELTSPKPLAFLAHGAMLPIPRQKDGTFRKYGVPKGVHWIVRTQNDSGAQPDPKVKVHVDPARSSLNDLQPLVLQRVYYAPEDGMLEDEEFFEEGELLDDEMEGLEDEDEESLANEEEPAFVPYGSRSMQQFLTHLRTNVYHTFDLTHHNYDHEKIVEDPIAFMTENPHPDFVGPERLAGYDHPPHPHPLRASSTEEGDEF